MGLHRSLEGRFFAGLTTLALTACGGSEGDPSAAPVSAQQPSAVVHADLASVPAEERSQLAALSPESGPDAVRLLVTLNPAAVAEAPVRSAAILSADTSPQQSQTLRAVRSVSAQALAGHRASVHAHFADALQGFGVSVAAAELPALIRNLQANPTVARIELDRLVTLHSKSQDDGGGADDTIDADDGVTADTTLPAGSRAATQPAGSLAPTAVVNKPAAGWLWGLDRLDQRQLPLDNLYANSVNGAGVRAYVVDTGIAPHQDFGARLQAGYTAVSDGNGTVDCNGHGTHVAGTLAGTRSGVAPAALLVPVRVTGCSGAASMSAVLQGLDWIAANGVRPAVVNISLGGTAYATLDQSVAALAQRGFTVVVAAGNANKDACGYSPARASAAITVGATDSVDNRAAYSNWGSCIDLFAPGSAVQSADFRSLSGTTVKSGTSMAAPHVAGTAALLLQSRPWLQPAQVASQLIAQASPTLVKTAGTGSPNRLLFAGAAPQLGVATPASVRVETLTGSALAETSTTWAARAQVQVVNASGGASAGTTVTGAVSTASTPVTCTTSAAGSCQLQATGLSRAKTASATFAITGLSATGQVYAAGANKLSSVTVQRAP